MRAGEAGAARVARRRGDDALGSDDDVDALAPDAPRVAAAASRSLLAGWSEADKAELVALFETVRCGTCGHSSSPIPTGFSRMPLIWVSVTWSERTGLWRRAPPGACVLR